MTIARILVAAWLTVCALPARATDQWGITPDEEYFCSATERCVPLAVRAMDQLHLEESPDAAVAVPGMKIEPPRSRVAAALRSVVLPGLGQMYNGQYVKGSLILSTEIALLGSALGFHLAGASAETAAREMRSMPDSGGRAQQLADSSAARYRVRDRLLLVGTGLWALNILDAFLNGARPVGVPAAVDGAFSKSERGLAPLAAIRPGGAVVGVKGRF